MPQKIEFEPIQFEEDTPPARSWLGNAWDTISKPLTDAPSRFASSVAESIDPRDTSSPSMLRGFLAGATEGVGDLLSDFTSPINLAGMALTGGASAAAKSGAGSLARIASRAATVPSALSAGHGVGEVVRPDASLTERATGLLEAVGGVAGVRQGLPTRTNKTNLSSIADNVLADETPVTPKITTKTKSPVVDFELDDIPVSEVRGPGYRNKVLEDAGDGTPGLAVEEKPWTEGKTRTTVIYRGPDGKPVASAILQKNDKGQLAVSNIASAEGKGMLSGRAVKAITDKLVEMDAARPFSGVSPDAQNMITKLLGRTGQVNDKIQVLNRKSVTPERVKSLREKGFELEGVNEAGDFTFRQTGNVASPVLESEVGINRPTPKNAAMQAAGLPPKPGTTGSGTIPPNQPPTSPSFKPAGPEPVVPATPEKSNLLLDAYNLPRATMASLDFSAPLRQGLGLIHKKEFWTSLKPMFSSWAKEANFKANQDAIKMRPLFRPRVVGGKVKPSFAEDSGLYISDLDSISMREENLVSKLAEKLPGVRRSNRAYTAFLNNLRADTFESLVKDAKILGPNAEADLPLARAMADFVNTASGRGSLGKLEQSAKVLSNVMFSPRLMASRLQLLNPQYYWSAPAPVRKEAIKSLLAVAAAGNTVTQLGRMAGGTVSSDPSSSDFGKLKIGDTRIDPFGGFQQYIVAANRLVNPMGPMTGFEGETPFTRGGMVTSSKSGKSTDIYNPEGPYDPSWMSVLGRFARGKAHPTLGFAISLLMGAKEMDGTPMDFSTKNPMKNSIAQRFIPLILQDMYEVSQENPELLPITVPLSTFGMGTQTYTNPGAGRP